MSDHIFREYDIRGVAERDLTDDTVTAIGRGLGQMLRPSTGKPPRLVVGRDCRLSGPRLFDALVRGLVAEGADVTDIGVGPTPMMYFAVHHLEPDGGIHITGSHNPARENGFKIMRGRASFFGDAIQELKAKVTRGFGSASGRGSVQAVSVQDAYVAHLSRGTTIADPKLPFVVDAGNGAAGPLGIRTLKATGLNPIAMYCDMDGSFPNHHPDPTVPENLAALVARVKSEGARVGIAWDGDGDRLGVVDSNGDIIWGDRLLALFARYALVDRPGGAVLGDVKCSQTLFDDVTRHGGRPIMWKTGHSLIKTKMKEESALLAGEMSGHFFFADRYFGYDDAIYAALRLLEILTKEGKTVGQLLSDMPKTYATPEIRIDCPDAVKSQVVAVVKRRLKNEGKLNDIDGARVTYDDGAWGLVRPSNTSPVIVLRFEAPSDARLAELRSHVEGLVAGARRELSGS